MINHDPSGTGRDRFLEGDVNGLTGFTKELVFNSCSISSIGRYMGLRGSSGFSLGGMMNSDDGVINSEDGLINSEDGLINSPDEGTVDRYIGSIFCPW